MHIDGPIAFAVAQAYGAHREIHVAQATAATPVQQLVAAQVSGIATFDSVALADVQPLQLYTRCADRIEAATRIGSGHLLDIQA